MSAILDSGNRRTFQTGAVRDIQEGKGRCDLLPLLPIYNMLRDDILFCVNQFEDSGDPKYLLEAVLQFSTEFDNSVYTMPVSYTHLIRLTRLIMMNEKNYIFEPSKNTTEENKNFSLSWLLIRLWHWSVIQNRIFLGIYSWGLALETSINVKNSRRIAFVNVWLGFL